MAVLDEIQDHFRVQEIAAREGAEVLGEAGHLHRSAVGALDPAQRDVVADPAAVVDPVAGVVHQIPQWSVVRRTRVQSAAKITLLLFKFKKKYSNFKKYIQILKKYSNFDIFFKF